MGSPFSVSSMQQISSGAGRHPDTGLHFLYGEVALAHRAEMCHKCKKTGNKASFLPRLLQTHGPEPPVVAGVSNICSFFFWQRQEHPCITLVVMESLCLSGSNLVLGGLLRQLRVRRKRVLKHYTPGAPCTHSLPPCKTYPQVGQGCMACVLLQGKCHHSMWPSFG